METLETLEVLGTLEALVLCEVVGSCEVEPSLDKVGVDEVVLENHGPAEDVVDVFVPGTAT